MEQVQLEPPSSSKTAVRQSNGRLATSRIRALSFEMDGCAKRKLSLFGCLASPKSRTPGRCGCMVVALCCGWDGQPGFGSAAVRLSSLAPMAEIEPLAELRSLFGGKQCTVAHEIVMTRHVFHALARTRNLLVRALQDYAESSLCKRLRESTHSGRYTSDNHHFHHQLVLYFMHWLVPGASWREFAEACGVLPVQHTEGGMCQIAGRQHGRKGGLDLCAYDGAIPSCASILEQRSKFCLYNKCIEWRDLIWPKASKASFRTLHIIVKHEADCPWGVQESLCERVN
eukprot:scaffold8922_cov17-Tisochrysis_lutea.AAC.1